MIIRLIALIKDSQITVNWVIYFLQIFNTVITYCLLRKVAGKFISFSLTLFLLTYCGSITIVVDSFIQPLLAVILLMLISMREEKSNFFILIFCGLLTGLVWLIRQNVGLFLACLIITWINIFNVSFDGGKDRMRRFLLWVMPVLYFLCGLVVLKIIGPVDDKIWYGMCYIIFWMLFFVYINFKKSASLNISTLWRSLFLFFGPLVLLLVVWFYNFGKVVGLGRYLYIQYIAPFDFINVFTYPISFHLNIARETFMLNISEGGLRHFYRGFQSLMQWGIMFMLPFAINCIVVGYAGFMILKRKVIGKKDLLMIVIPVMGILTFYPVESYWILSSKMVLFFLALAYFLNKPFVSKIYMYAVCLIFIFVSFSRLAIIPAKYMMGLGMKKGESYAAINNKSDLKLPENTALALREATKIIKDSVKEEKFYIVDSYTDLEMFYGIVDYRHSNYYIFLRKDAMNKEAEEDLMKRLEGYSYILMNKTDYLSCQTEKDSYFERPRSISKPLMEYIFNNYESYAGYVHPADVNDIWIPDFVILKKKPS
jgi:hypothetical protein